MEPDTAILPAVTATLEAPKPVSVSEDTFALQSAVDYLNGVKVRTNSPQVQEVLALDNAPVCQTASAKKRY